MNTMFSDLSSDTLEQSELQHRKLLELLRTETELEDQILFLEKQISALKGKLLETKRAFKKLLLKQDFLTQTNETCPVCEEQEEKETKPLITQDNLLEQAQKNPELLKKLIKKLKS